MKSKAVRSGIALLFSVTNVFAEKEYEGKSDMKKKSWRAFKRQKGSSLIFCGFCCFLLLLEIYVCWFRSGQPLYSVERRMEVSWKQVKETIEPGLDWMLQIRLRIRDGTLEVYRIHYPVPDSPISKNYE